MVAHHAVAFGPAAVVRGGPVLVRGHQMSVPYSGSLTEQRTRRTLLPSGAECREVRFAAWLTGLLPDQEGYVALVVDLSIESLVVQSRRGPGLEKDACASRLHTRVPLWGSFEPRQVERPRRVLRRNPDPGIVRQLRLRRDGANHLNGTFGQREHDQLSLLLIFGPCPPCPGVAAVNPIVMPRRGQSAAGASARTVSAADTSPPGRIMRTGVVRPLSAYSRTRARHRSGEPCTTRSSTTASGMRASAPLRSPAAHASCIGLSTSPRPSHSWNAAYTGTVR